MFRLICIVYWIFSLSLGVFADDDDDTAFENEYYPPALEIPDTDDTLVPSGNLYVNPEDGKAYVPLGGNSVLDTSTGEVHP